MRIPSVRLLSRGLFAWIMLLHLFMSPTGRASPFARQFQYTQPDGTTVRLWGQGDDFSAVFETLDGYTVIFVPEARAYFYARVSTDGESLESTGAQVGRDNPALFGLKRHQRMKAQAAVRAARANYEAWDKTMQQSERWASLKAATLRTGPHVYSPPSFQTVGVKCGLTMLIDFEDERGVFSREEVSEFLNGDNYTRFENNGSVKQYFTDVSNGRLTFTNVVTPYITIPNSVHPRSWYNDPTKDAMQQCQYLIRDAMNVMKKLPNYTNDFLPLFDALTLDAYKNVVSANFYVAGMNSGVWAKGIWGQTSALSYSVGSQILTTGKIVNGYQLCPMEDKLTIMVFCHENGHLLCGFPDIYDYNWDCLSGAGCLCLMAGGQFWATNPSQVCAYLKTAAGWATVVDLPVGTNFLASLSASGAGFNRFFRFRKPGTPTEYFLLENRQKQGRDAEIPSSGIVVWHVDELGNRDNQSLRTNSAHLNYELSLEQADYRWDLQFGVNSGDAEDLFYEGNPAPGYANGFSDLTSPSAQWWNGTRSGLALSDFNTNDQTMTFQVGVEPVIVRVDPVDLTVIEGQPAGFGFILASTVTNATMQWYKDGVPLIASPGISGVDSNMFRIAVATLSDAGDYSAVITHPTGTNSTRVARLTVTGSLLLSSSYGSGTTTLVPEGVDVTAPASRFGGTSDTFRFVYQQRSGDFDARVRILGISMKSTQTRAGLTVRGALVGSSPHVTVLNGLIPDGQRCGVLSRFTNAAPNRDLLSFLSPHDPNDGESWLRLRREGNRFTCYRSENGSQWFWLKSVECDLGEAPYVGVVLAAGSDATEAASASFRHYEVLTNAPSTLAIFSPDFIAQEGSLNNAEVAVHSSRNGPLQARVNLAGTAVSGIDYVAPTEVEIPAGTNVGVLTLEAINNTEPALPKKVEVSLAEQPGLEMVQPTNTAILILDDEQTLGGLTRQVYTNIGGVAVSELTAQMTNSTAMTDVSYATNFEVDTSTNALMYGQVLSGYLVPPETGNYVFYLASDDTSELWLSTDEDPAHLRRIASVAGFTLFRFYSGSGNHSSAVPLEKGRKYFVQALHKQGYSAGCFSVAWQLPGGAAPANGSEPIGGQYLAFSLLAAPAIEIAFPGGDSFELACETGGALVCVLEASKDLVSWVPVWTNNLPARLQLGAIDPACAEQPVRFYRAALK